MSLFIWLVVFLGKGGDVIFACAAYRYKKKKKKEPNLQNLFFANLANVVTSLNAKSYVREKKNAVPACKLCGKAVCSPISEVSGKSKLASLTFTLSMQMFHFHWKEYY